MWLNNGAVGCNQIDALMRGIVASDVAKIALNALVFVVPGDGNKNKVQIFEVKNSGEGFPCDIGNGPKALGIHPLGETVTEIFDNTKAVMHDGSADLQAGGSQK